MTRRILGLATCASLVALVAPVALVALVASPLAPAETDGLPQRLDRVRAALAEGNAASAESLARDLIRDHPGYGDAYGALADALVALDRGPEAANVLLEAGQGLVHAGNVRTGREFLEEAARLGPRSAAIHAALGNARLRDRAHAGAVESLGRAIDLGLDGPRVHTLLGAALWETGALDEATASFRRAIAARPDDPTALASLGGLLVFRGRFDEARDPLERAVRLDPAHVAARADLARALAGAGNLPEAAQAFAVAIALDPSIPGLHYEAARVCRALGKDTRASAHLDSFRKLHALDQERTHRASVRRARLDDAARLLAEGRADEAVLALRDLEPTAEVLVATADALEASGDVPSAVRALRRAVVLEPDDRGLRVRLARLEASASR